MRSSHSFEVKVGKEKVGENYCEGKGGRGDATVGTYVVSRRSRSR